MTIETANRLRQMRNQKGLSQEELAAKIGVTRQAVSKWERAEASPDTDNLMLLAKLYGTTIDELLNGSEAPASEGISLKKDETSGNDKIVREVFPENNSEEVYPDSGAGESSSIPQGSPFGADISEEERKAASSDVGDSIERAGRAIGDALNAAGRKINEEMTKKDADGRTIGDKLESGAEKVRGGIEKGVSKLDKKLSEKSSEWEAKKSAYSGSESKDGEKASATLLDKTFPILITALFFLTVPMNLAHPGWTLFLLIPLYYTGKAAIRKRDPMIFCYPVLCVLFYCAIGGFFDVFIHNLSDNWYGTMWLVFLTIPLYYTLIPALRKRNPLIFCYPVLCLIVYLGMGILMDMFSWYFAKIWFATMWAPILLTIPLYYIVISHYRSKNKADVNIRNA